MPAGRSIAVIGAGIAGLSTAIVMRSFGLEVELYEKSPASASAGLGINLQPYAVAALDALGLAEAVAAAGRPCRRWSFVDENGREIASEPLPELGGWPRVSISRAALTTLLDDAADAAGCRAHRGVELVGLHDNAKTVSFELAGPLGLRSSGEVDALLGADGIGSTVRGLLVPGSGAPRHAGKVLWRGTTLAEPVLDGDTMVIAGSCARKFVLYPIGPTRPDGRQEINWVAEMEVRDDAGVESWDDAVAAGSVAEAYAGLDFDWLSVPQLILAAGEVLRFSMLDRDPLERWSFDRVTLAGDAAHPMYPVGSNGASQAIRDAAALGAALSNAASVVEAFAGYEAERRPEANALVLANREMGPDSVLDLPLGSGPHAAAARRQEALAVLASYRQLTAARTSRSSVAR